MKFISGDTVDELWKSREDIIELLEDRMVGSCYRHKGKIPLDDAAVRKNLKKNCGKVIWRPMMECIELCKARNQVPKMTSKRQKQFDMKNWQLRLNPTLKPYAHLAHLERPFPYLVGVGLVLRLHSVRSRAISWVTPTAVMSSFSCWFHVFLGRPRRLVPGINKI